MSIPTSTPSQQGIDPHGLLRFIEAVNADPQIEPHGLIIQRHGQRVLESYWSPHRAGQARLVYSLSKSFTGAALGLAVGDGLLSLDDLVIDHLPTDGVEVSKNTARMRIRHLASMATGHQDETLLAAFMADPADLVGAFLSIPPEHEPGSWFAYNQPPVLALSALLNRLTGKRLVDQLQDRLLEPMGISNFSWTQYRPGIDVGFSGVFTDLDAIARLGQLHLDRGLWAGQQILPAEWVDQASTSQVDNSQRPEPDWRLGYGFQLWMCRHGYRGDGAFGQYMLVLPEWDCVVAFFSCTDPMQTFMDHVWNLLVPALTNGTGMDAAGDELVADRTASLKVRTASQHLGESAPLHHLTTGRFEPPTASPCHPTITLLDVGTDVVTIHEGDVAIEVPVREEWTEVPGFALAASAATDDGGALRIDLATLASPHRLEITTDPSTSTFQATWPLPPLFGLGLELALSNIRPPA